MPTISLNLPPSLVESGVGFSFEIMGNICNSKFLATVTQLSDVDLLSLKNGVADTIQNSVDLAGLLFGAGLEVDIISAAADNGSWRFFDAFIPAIMKTGRTEVSTELLVAVGGDVASHIALADFRGAMRVPVQTGFFCYRAAEAIMQTFKTAEVQKDAVAWAKMRNQLHISEEALRRIKLHADWARHGQAGVITDPERAQLLVVTQKMIRRYLDYLLRVKAPLNVGDYPTIE